MAPINVCRNRVGHAFHAFVNIISNNFVRQLHCPLISPPNLSARSTKVNQNANRIRYSIMVSTNIISKIKIKGDFIMSTLSSKPPKRYSPVDLLSVFVFLALILALLVIPFTGNIYTSLTTALGTGNHTQTNFSGNVSYSFSADQQYWAANCSHGWSSNSTCDEIVTRSQSCSISGESAYCLEYANYLKEFSN
jgi:hypothetical protein